MVEANCVGSIEINSGGSATFNLAIYNAGASSGASFAIAGSDATYSYNGSANTTPSNCNLAMLSGVYVFTSTGYGFSGAAVNEAGNITGLLQFDGHGNVTANANVGSSSTVTGTYSMSSNCVGSATLTDANGKSSVMSLSVYSGNTAASTDFYVTLAQSSKFMVIGTAHAVYGQPTASLRRRGSGRKA